MRIRTWQESYRQLPTEQLRELQDAFAGDRLAAIEEGFPRTVYWCEQRLDFIRGELQRRQDRWQVVH